MLDTNICSFIMRKQPLMVLKKLQAKVENRDKIVISAITYAELRYGTIGEKASRKHHFIVNEFLQRVQTILAWDKKAVDQTIIIKKILSDKGTPIGINDTMIAGHAIAENCILVTNNTREFIRVPQLILEDWVC